MAAGPPRARRARPFRALGFPTVRDEEWRFTNVAPIAGGEFRWRRRRDGLSPARVDELPYRRRDASVVVVNGRFSPELSRVGGLPRGVTRGSLARQSTASCRPIARSCSAISGSSRTSDPRVRGAQHRLPRGRRLRHVPDGGRARAADPDPVRRPPGRASTVSRTRAPDRARRAQPGARSSRPTSAAATRAISPTPSPRCSSARGAVLDHYKVQQESEQAFHLGSMHVHAARSANFSSHSFSLGGARSQRRAGDARRRRRRGHAERAVSGRRRSAGRQPHDDRSRASRTARATRSTRASSAAAPRRVQRQDHRPAGRAEDRRQADQPARCCCPTTR